MLCLNNGNVVSVIKSRVGEGRWKEMTFGSIRGVMLCGVLEVFDGCE